MSDAASDAYVDDRKDVINWKMYSDLVRLSREYGINLPKEVLNSFLKYDNIGRVKVYVMDRIKEQLKSNIDIVDSIIDEYSKVSNDKNITITQDLNDYKIILNLSSNGGTVDGLLYFQIKDEKCSEVLRSYIGLYGKSKYLLYHMLKEINDQLTTYKKSRIKCESCGKIVEEYMEVKYDCGTKVFCNNDCFLKDLFEHSSMTAVYKTVDA